MLLGWIRVDGTFQHDSANIQLFHMILLRVKKQFNSLILFIVVLIIKKKFHWWCNTILTTKEHFEPIYFPEVNKSQLLHNFILKNIIILYFYLFLFIKRPSKLNSYFDVGYSIICIQQFYSKLSNGFNLAEQLEIEHLNIWRISKR